MINVTTLNNVKRRIGGACDRSGRSAPEEIKIVAITKTFPAKAITSAHNSGLTAIGENRVQEASGKFPQLPKLPRLNKRLVGHLQMNKTRKAVELFDSIDSVDSLKLARRLSEISKEKNTILEVLLQVNTANDPTKHGLKKDEIDTFLEIMELESLDVRGLMTIGELTLDKSTTRKTFRTLRRLMDQLNGGLRNEKKLSELSMGMSGDFEIAVEEGATMVRLGTALFGIRDQ